MAGRAFQYGQILAGADTDEDGGCWWVPLVDGTERPGVLRITTAAADPRAVGDMKLLSALIALLVDSKRRSGETHARLTRIRPLNIAADGDAYDYAIAGPVVHPSLLDATGPRHGRRADREPGDGNLP